MALSGVLRKALLPSYAWPLTALHSVSVLQWLCNADASSHSPPQRLQRFFATLIASLVRGARAVFQFYPESDDQVAFLMSFATRAGFGGGLVVDYPNSKKAKKYYLVLQAGQADQRVALPKPLGVDGELAPEEEERIAFEKRRAAHAQARNKRGKRKPIKGTRDYIERKKDLNRARGKDVPHDSKCVPGANLGSTAACSRPHRFTGRKRRVKF
jgi:18S rRNA (guanine1575-N7)-methyltransferase